MKARLQTLERRLDRIAPRHKPRLDEFWRVLVCETDEELERLRERFSPESVDAMTARISSIVDLDAVPGDEDDVSPTFQ